MEIKRLTYDYEGKHFCDYPTREIINRLAECEIMLEALEQESKTGHCKDCKWWKDKDGVYRRGISAESKCPINRREVMEGRGYCYLFEPQESEG